MKTTDPNAVAATCSACGRAARVSIEYDATGAMLRVRKDCACAGGDNVHIPEGAARSLKREVVRG